MEWLVGLVTWCLAAVVLALALGRWLKDQR